MNEEQKFVGKTSATDRSSNTSDKFSFWLGDGVIVNPFDIVEVEQIGRNGKSKTYGLVTTLEQWTDSPNHLANYISSNFGELTETPNTPGRAQPLPTPMFFPTPLISICRCRVNNWYVLLHQMVSTKR